MLIIFNHNTHIGLHVVVNFYGFLGLCKTPVRRRFDCIIVGKKQIITYYII